LAQYYYTIATLPFFSYDAVSAIRSEDFLARCAEDMSDSAYCSLCYAKLDISDQKEDELPAFLISWYRFERELRNELVRSRAAGLGMDAAVYVRPGEGPTGIEEIVRDALGQPTPLQAEDVLNKARWRKLEEMEVGHYFDLQRMMIIYLKLQLLERKGAFRPELGTERFEEIYADVREAVASASSTGNGES